MARVGIVILNYITWQETANCIQSIKETKQKNSVKIYIVDNSSPEKENLRALCEKEQVVLIENVDNLGYAVGNNVGIKNALEDGCDYILVSNNDVLFKQGCIDYLCEYLKDNKAYGIVAPKILSPDGIIQQCHLRKMTSYSDIWNTQTIFRHFRKKQVDELYGDNAFYEKNQDIFAGSGCCFMMRRQCAEDITPLDENTFLYEEENIIGYRMRQKKWKTAYVVDSEVIHNHNQTGKLVKPFALICWACSEIYYCKKYLHKSNVLIYILYLYRTFIYLLHSIRNKKYGESWKKYRVDTKKYLELITGNSEI